jgi:hypothetical protein
MNTVNTKIYMVWPSESNIIRPRKNEVVLLKLDLTRVSLTLSSFSDPREVASTRTFYNSRSGSYNEFQGTTAGLGAGKTLYCRAQPVRSSK